jgi:hypothetical protein
MQLVELEYVGLDAYVGFGIVDRTGPEKRRSRRWPEIPPLDAWPDPYGIVVYLVHAGTRGWEGMAAMFADPAYPRLREQAKAAAQATLRGWTPASIRDLLVDDDGAVTADDAKRMTEAIRLRMFRGIEKLRRTLPLPIYRNGCVEIDPGIRALVPFGGRPSAVKTSLAMQGIVEGTGALVLKRAALAVEGVLSSVGGRVVLPRPDSLLVEIPGGLPGERDLLSACRDAMNETFHAVYPDVAPRIRARGWGPESRRFQTS